MINPVPVFLQIFGPVGPMADPGSPGNGPACAQIQPRKPTAGPGSLGTGALVVCFFAGHFVALGCHFLRVAFITVLCFKVLWLCASLLVISWLLGATFYVAPSLQFCVLKWFGCVLLCWSFRGSWVPLSTCRLHYSSVF